MQQISTAKEATQATAGRAAGQRTVRLNLYVRARIAFKMNDWDLHASQGSSGAHTQLCICADGDGGRPHGSRLILHAGWRAAAPQVPVTCGLGRNIQQLFAFLDSVQASQ